MVGFLKASDLKSFPKQRQSQKAGGVDSVDLIKAQRRKMMQQITANMMAEKKKEFER